MKVLLTGATGFLGRHVLELLIAEERVREIVATSRTKKTHPNPKVRVVRLDLADPAQLINFDIDFDAVIHLAGLYDFDENYGSCYAQNVLPALSLVQKLSKENERRRIPLYFASTYAVGFGLGKESSESPLLQLPSKDIPYAYTKAVAERTITDSSIPSAVFRLGILVGRSSDGATDKLDGAYSFVRFIEDLSRKKGIRRIQRYLPIVPLPGDPNGLLPLVPVDAAAKIFADALFDPEAAASPSRIYGVYNSESVRIQKFGQAILEEFMPGSREVFIRRIPEPLLKLQQGLSSVPAGALRFSMNPVPLSNPGFIARFGENRIPAFDKFRHQFFRGYLRQRSLK